MPKRDSFEDEKRNCQAGFKYALPDVEKVLKGGLLNEAVVLGVPPKATIKEANNDSFCGQNTRQKNTMGNVDPTGHQTGTLTEDFIFPLER